MSEYTVQLRAQLEAASDRIDHQREALECLNGRRRELAYWHLRDKERKLKRLWAALEEIEQGEFASSVLKDIASL